MKKTIILLFTVYCLLSVSGCKLTTQKYNDKIVDILDSTGIAIEETVEAYDSSIPNLVTEEVEIDTLAMREALTLAEAEAEKADGLVELESKNIKQQEEVQTELTVYTSALHDYVSKYTEMVEYYESSSHQTNPNMVSDFDSELYDSGNLFDTFLESNNTLAEILKSHI